MYHIVSHFCDATGFNTCRLISADIAGAHRVHRGPTEGFSPWFTLPDVQVVLSRRMSRFHPRSKLSKTQMDGL